MSGEFSDKMQALRHELIEAARVVTEDYTHGHADKDYEAAIDRLQKAHRAYDNRCKHCGEKKT